MDFENVTNSIDCGSDTDDQLSKSALLEEITKKPLAVGSSDSSDRIKRKAKRLSKHGNGSSSGITGVNGLSGIVAPHFVAPHRRWKNSRRSRNGYGRGLPKKGGAGGKGVWGYPGSELLEEDYEDQNDPNYDSEVNDRNIELKEVIPEITPEEFIKKTEPIIAEYFENGDSWEVARSIDEFLTGPMRAMVTYVAIEVSMDRKQSHREMTSVLISDLYGRIITGKDISKGNNVYIYLFLSPFYLFFVLSAIV